MLLGCGLGHDWCGLGHDWCGLGHDWCGLGHDWCGLGHVAARRAVQEELAAKRWYSEPELGRSDPEY
jgi:hypothetical protein